MSITSLMITIVLFVRVEDPFYVELDKIGRDHIRHRAENDQLQTIVNQYCELIEKYKEHEGVNRARLKLFNHLRRMRSRNSLSQAADLVPLLAAGIDYSTEFGRDCAQRVIFFEIQEADMNRRDVDLALELSAGLSQYYERQSDLSSYLDSQASVVLLVGSAHEAVFHCLSALQDKREWIERELSSEAFEKDHRRYDRVKRSLNRLLNAIEQATKDCAEPVKVVEVCDGFPELLARYERLAGVCNSCKSVMSHNETDPSSVATGASKVELDEGRFSFWFKVLLWHIPLVIGGLVVYFFWSKNRA